MNGIFIIIFSILLWIVSLVQGSGLGNSINITNKFHILLFIILVPIILITIRKSSKLNIRKNYFIFIFYHYSFIIKKY